MATARNFTFYWHDYETFGTDPRRDQAVQFAGIRTDQDLNIIGDPLMVYCKPSNDSLPQPEACLVTGITPQLALREGISEAEFIRTIITELGLPGTCGVGYNSIRFDDEVTRNLLYRNFHDPYAREWENGNSRWDIIDMLRLTRALRPEGIHWPNKEDGSPSFRLDQITVANDIAHEGAHDALSDVYASIAVAKLVKERQPKLYDYLLQHRDKHKLRDLLDVRTMTPIVHVSGQYPARQGCLALVVPLARHPHYQNEIIVYNLAIDPEPLLALSAEDIHTRVFTAAANLPEGVQRIPLKSIHLNKCPVVVPEKVLRPQDAERLGVDRVLCQQHLEKIKTATGLEQKLQSVWESKSFAPETNPDLMLYGGGFFSAADKKVMAQIRKADAAELRDKDWRFKDSRLAEMLFRYRARNFSESLTAEEAVCWQNFRSKRLSETGQGTTIVEDDYRRVIQEKLVDSACSQEHRVILQALSDYADEIISPVPKH